MATTIGVAAGFPWTQLLTLLSLLMILAIPVGLVLVAVGVVQYFRPLPEPDALERLARRYADGEITLSEYEEMRAQIAAVAPKGP